MATVVAAPPGLNGDLTLYHTTDPFFSNAPILVYHGLAATVGAVSSRTQLHIFTIAGHASYTRLAVSPSSPFYSAVSNLPREEQGDETVRSIAFGLRKYFAELPELIKQHLRKQAPRMPGLFEDGHVAVLASRFKVVQNIRAVSDDLVRSFAEQKLSWLDIDVILPPNSMAQMKDRDHDWRQSETTEQQFLVKKYGKYADIVAAFGEQTFLPTSKIKRAPSKVQNVGRSLSFLKQQKQKARMAMVRLASSESEYCKRLTELQLLGTAITSESRHGDFQVPIIVATTLELVERMRDKNQELRSELEKILLETDESFNHDYSNMQADRPTSQQVRTDFQNDNQGLCRFAAALFQAFPRFHDEYLSYTKQFSECLEVMRTWTREDSVPQCLKALGEQRLASLMIEPIQRLPRYVLQMDEIAKELPVRHVALQILSEAKDRVSALCDEEDVNEETIIKRLQTRIDGWPNDLSGIGRTITAVDYVNLSPPYNIETSKLGKGMLLLSTDGIALFERVPDRTITARVFMTELEASRKPVNATHDYIFLRWLPMNSFECTEGHDGQSIHLTIVPDESDQQADTSMVLLLEGPLEGKASRLTEDITKTRVEARFDEEEREGFRWEVRATEPASAGSLRLISAMFEDSDSKFTSCRHDTASIRIIVDVDKHAQNYRAGKKGTHTVIALSTIRNGSCRLSVNTVEGASMVEQISIADLALHLQRKIAAALAVRHGTVRPSMAQLHVQQNRDVLLSIQLQLKEETNLNRGEQDLGASYRQNPLRPLSPVKMLTNILSSSVGPSAHPPAVLKKEMSGSSVLKTASSFGMLSSRINGHVSSKPAAVPRPKSNDQPRPKSSSSARSFITTSEPAKRLEGTLTAYVMALKARKGNIVGRTLKMRAEADELVVNELYNQMIEQNNMIAAASQSPVDVLFAAFEKFLRAAWTEQLGPVLPPAFLEKTRDKADTMFPSDFDEYFRAATCALSTSSQYAFREIITLLNELLDGTGNDADRGALTAAFAEVLVLEGNANDYIALIDKFVNDADTYFGEPLVDQSLQSDLTSRTNSHKRSRSVNTGSITSNTSSLRRKFGLGGLSRENSKSEHDNRSVWRTLSKSRSKEASPGSSLSSRTEMQRARSTESESRSQSRPTSSHGVDVRNVQSELLTVPTVPSSILPGLSTIGEHPSFIPTGPPRKKRRSSLSDLKLLATPFATPQRPGQSPLADQGYASRLLPSSPLASTPSSKENSLRMTSPSRANSRPALPPSFRVESISTPPKRAPTDVAAERTATTSSSAKPRESSGIPTLTPRALRPSAQKPQPVTPLRIGLSERTDGGNVVKPASPRGAKGTEGAIPAKRLRMQSPQKIRDRLQVEQAAIAAAHTSLQDELGKLSEEVALTPNRLMPSRSPSNAKTMSASASRTQLDAAGKVLKLEAMATTEIEALNTSLQKIQGDVSSSLTVLETKCKKLDELYKEANAENEALYARYNDELARVLRAVRAGDGVEQLKQRLKQQDDEVTRLKRENARLKREVVGLRSQFKE